MLLSESSILNGKTMQYQIKKFNKLPEKWREKERASEMARLRSFSVVEIWRRKICTFLCQCRMQIDFSFLSRHRTRTCELNTIFRTSHSIFMIDPIHFYRECIFLTTNTLWAHRFKTLHTAKTPSQLQYQKENKLIKYKVKNGYGVPSRMNQLVWMKASQNTVSITFSVLIESMSDVDSNVVLKLWQPLFHMQRLIVAESFCRGGSWLLWCSVWNSHREQLLIMLIQSIRLLMQCWTRCCWNYNSDRCIASRRCY